MGEPTNHPAQQEGDQPFNPELFRARVRNSAEPTFRAAGELTIVLERDVRAYELGVAHGLGIALQNLMGRPLGMVIAVAGQLAAGQRELIAKPRPVDPKRLRIAGP